MELHLSLSLLKEQETLLDHLEVLVVVILFLRSHTLEFQEEQHLVTLEVFLLLKVNLVVLCTTGDLVVEELDKQDQLVKHLVLMQDLVVTESHLQ